MTAPATYVCSLGGLRKQVCSAGSTCANLNCSQSHPNSSGSVVKHPKWCVSGWIDSCTKATCPFNHFLTEAYFVKYRENDETWANLHTDLVEKHKHSAPFLDVRPVISTADNHGNYYNSIWYPPGSVPTNIKKKIKRANRKRHKKNNLGQYFEVLDY